MHRFPLVLSALICLSLPIYAQDFVEDFETGIAAAVSYHKPPNEAKLELGTGNAFSGQQYVRATTAGERNLEGFAVRATGLTGARLATVTAQVRGKGDLWLCLISRNGWLYSPQTVTLTDQWQEVSLSKVLVAADTTLGINFITETAQAVVFEVDHIEVTLAPELQVFDAEVGPWLLEAEDHATRRNTVANDADASGGALCQAEQYVPLAGFPFPRSSRPVTVYARAKAAHAADTFRLLTSQGGNRQILQSVKADQPDQWRWVAFAPVVAGEVGDRFIIEAHREKGTAGVAAIDCIVISTQAGLTPEQLAAAPPLTGRRPMALVTRAEAAPVLDGKLDDACWSQTVALSGFIGIGSTLPAQADTTVRLCYDQANLYAFFECDEPILNVAQQRRHEFRATVEDRDGDVYADDAVIMLLQAGAGKPVYDFTANALGTVMDAVCEESKIWESRDTGWQSGAEARGTIGEDIWTLEMAIPWADLGGAPQVGDAWQAIIGRLSKARRETTSWNLSNRGFHDPVRMGLLVFGGPMPGLTLEAPTGLQMGKNALSARIPAGSGGAHGVYLLSQLALPAKMQHNLLFAPVTDAEREEQLPFEVPGEAELEMAFGALDAASLQPLYLTPRLPRAVKSSSATLTIASEGPFELYLNEELVQRADRADAVEIKVPLQKGANVFALKLAQGTAAVGIEAQDHSVGSEAWKMADDSPAAIAIATDDGDWPAADVVGQHEQLGVVVGQPGKPTVLRHTLLWEKTRIWPTPSPAYYVAQGVTSHIVVLTDGLKGRKLLDWSTSIAVPTDYEIVGSTGFYGTTRETQPQFICTQLGEQTVKDLPMRVAKVTANKPLLSGQHPIMSQFQAFVRYVGPPRDTETEATFLYWSEANGGALTEPIQSFNVRLLPEVRGAQATSYFWQLWGGWLSTMDDPDMREQILAASRKAGFTNIVSGDQWTTDRAPEYGMTNTTGIGFQSWNVNLKPHLEKMPDERLIDNAGKPNDGLMCTTLLLGDGWAAAEAALKERLDKSHPHCVDYDYEYGPAAGPHSCYCPRCLAAFKEFAGLGADVTLDADIIRSDYWPQWIDFMARRVARLCLQFKESIHRLYPGTVFSVYSGYHTPDNAERYGIDWRYIGELQAADHAGCGYGRPVEAIAATIEALKGIPLVCGALLVPYDTDLTTPQTPLDVAWLLRVVLDSTGGVLVYNRSTMDGRSWHAMGEATRLVAAHEEVFLKGQRTALPGLDPALVQMVTHGDTTLVCGLNRGNAALTHRIALPAAAGPGREFYSDKPVKAGETVEVTLEPGQAAVYVLTR